MFFGLFNSDTQNVCSLLLVNGEHTLSKACLALRNVDIFLALNKDFVAINRHEEEIIYP